MGRNQAGIVREGHSCSLLWVARQAGPRCLGQSFSKRSNLGQTIYFRSIYYF
ncbi:hypothetical protein ppKF707_4798 [Metapseudomonas furukawaii]|uniref:Uncharacterized protein n=1 Tax=Metapseudomonas furukawaii TaxID=1149133 RepID=A0AAD1BZT4_METFU|nr:hypothetical protein ppKF707_4798 [Pseudomonas furukawaii]BAU74686.1 hypothetical protein KF707C_29980 [Pseudomonas furukawaii]